MSGELSDPDSGSPGTSVEEINPSLTPQETITEVLERDILGAEFLMALFSSAMNSFRHDSILRPFPTMFLESDGAESGERSEREELKKDIEGLRQVFGSLPPLEKIARGNPTLSTQQVDLLQWILSPKRFAVSSKEPSFFSSLLEKWDSHSSSSDTLPRKPDYIFELEYNEESESKFRSITGDHGIMHAFHGSSVENFYSIVHNGLLNIFNKVSAFGEGTYLSTELGVCLNWSPNGSFQRGGSLPQVASCVAMCEVVKHPSVTSRQQVGGEPSIQGKIPEKYFIVSNDEFIRIKYIFVFETQKPVVRSRGWLYEHKYMVVLMLYLIFLFAVGASQSRVSKRFFRKYYNYYLS